MSATPLPRDAATPRLQDGGTLTRRDLYIERPEDKQFLDLLLDRQYVNVLTSRQMGKSSLMVRTAYALHEQEVRTAIVDLAAELGTPPDAATYFLGLLTKVTRDLQIEIDLRAWWDGQGEATVNQRLMGFFREVVLERIAAPVVVFLDEIDSTLKLAYTDDLFTALRGIHNQRGEVPAYERLTFCLLGVATPNELIKDRRTTPYNVGQTIELRDFGEQDDLTHLAEALGPARAVGQRMIERVLHWTGGHPYLALRLCTGLRQAGASSPEDVDRRVDEAFQNLNRVATDVHFQAMLRFLQTRLTDGLATFNLYQRILSGRRERDQTTPTHAELKLSGLVKRDAEGDLVVRNRIYARLFDRRWVANTKPKRALAGYRRWAIAASVAFVILGAGSLGVITYLGGQLNEREQLAQLNVTVVTVEHGQGNRITFPTEASQGVLEEAVPLLKGEATALVLSRAHVTDLTPLAGLTNLQRLDLDDTRVSELGPLAGLTSLQELTLANTQVSELGPLAGLTNLQGLDLFHTQVSEEQVARLREALPNLRVIQ